MEKKTILTLDQVKEIEKTYPTPFHIYERKGIRENARALKKAFYGTRVIANISQ